MPPKTHLTLTVVMAAYNEADTVATAIERVLGVELTGVDIELVIVESNSSDGTRSIVSRYSSDSRVRLVLQDTPRGKGAAVREGFLHATGDLILIQDADLEYSVEDYGKLIEPIMRGDVDFTLGCRHVPGEPVRVMHSMRKVAAIMNVAHWVLTWCFNVTYGTKLRDPFTMYKVFRTECIDGSRVRRRPFRLRLGARGQARPARVRTARNPGRVQLTWLRRRQEGALFP